MLLKNSVFRQLLILDGLERLFFHVKQCDLIIVAFDAVDVVIAQSSLVNIFNVVSQRTNFPFSFIKDFARESTVKTERESKASKEKDHMNQMSTTMVMALGIYNAVECSPGCL